MKLKLSREIFDKKDPHILNFIKIRPVGAELLHADRQTDVTKLIVAFHNSANAHNKRSTFRKLVHNADRSDLATRWRSSCNKRQSDLGCGCGCITPAGSLLSRQPTSGRARQKWFGGGGPNLPAVISSLEQLLGGLRQLSLRIATQCRAGQHTRHIRYLTACHRISQHLAVAFRCPGVLRSATNREQNTPVNTTTMTATAIMIMMIIKNNNNNNNAQYWQKKNT